MSDVESVKLRILFEDCEGIVWKLVTAPSADVTKWHIKNAWQISVCEKCIKRIVK